MVVSVDRAAGEDVDHVWVTITLDHYHCLDQAQLASSCSPRLEVRGGHVLFVSGLAVTARSLKM